MPSCQSIRRTLPDAGQASHGIHLMAIQSVRNDVEASTVSVLKCGNKATAIPNLTVGR